MKKTLNVLFLENIDQSSTITGPQKKLLKLSSSSPPQHREKSSKIDDFESFEQTILLPKNGSVFKPFFCFLKIMFHPFFPPVWTGFWRNKPFWTDAVEVILDSDFNVVTLKGREAVDNDPVGNELPWYPKAAPGDATCEMGEMDGNGGVIKFWNHFGGTSTYVNVIYVI